MATVVTVTSGKGGVGKTTTSAAVGAGLAQLGHRTVVIDFDVGLRNLDLIMGVERRVVFDFVNVISGEATLNQALIQDKRLENLSVLAASQTKDKDALTEEGVGQVLSQLAEMGFEYIVDCRGFKYLGPKDFMQGPMAECVEPKTGQIMVDIKGRVTNKHPIAANHKPASVNLHKNIFSFGDVCLTPANELKSIVSMYQYGY